MYQNLQRIPRSTYKLIALAKKEEEEEEEELHLD